MMQPGQTTPHKTGYLPSFDGWRALAILGVFMTHDLPWVIAGHTNAAFKMYGGSGVTLFFAISGILITTRILEEERMVGRFDLRRFYIRRIFRIQPVALVYLTVTAALIGFQIIHDHWYYWAAALFLFENFAWHPAATTVAFFHGHFWTLAVEEHFYILLSLLLFFLRRYRLAILTAAWLVLWIVEKFATTHGLFDFHENLGRTYWQLGYLVFPAMVAVALQRPGVRRWAVRDWKPWTAFALSIVVAVLHRESIHLRHPELNAFSATEWLTETRIADQFFFALWVAATMLHPKAWTTRLLEWAPLRFIGRLSYSLYLWHVLFFFQLDPGTNITNPLLMALSGRFAKYAAALAISLVSYYCLEKPMMRLGHRLAPPATPGRPELIEDSDDLREVSERPA